MRIFYKRNKILPRTGICGIHVIGRTFFGSLQLGFDLLLFVAFIKIFIGASFSNTE